jgi:hypothetical protein
MGEDEAVHREGPCRAHGVPAHDIGGSMIVRPARVGLPVALLTAGLIVAGLASPAGAAPAPGPQPRAEAALTPPTAVSRQRLSSILSGAVRASESGLRRGASFALTSEGGALEEAVRVSGRARGARVVSRTAGTTVSILDTRTQTSYAPLAVLAETDPVLVQEVLDAAGRPDARWVTIRTPRVTVGETLLGPLSDVAREARRWTWSRSAGLTRWTIDGRDDEGDYRVVLVLDARQRIVREVVTSTLDGDEARGVLRIAYRPVPPVRVPRAERTISLRTFLVTLLDLDSGAPDQLGDDLGGHPDQGQPSAWMR